jgi:hypothetical protein
LPCKTSLDPALNSHTASSIFLESIPDPGLFFP